MDFAFQYVQEGHKLALEAQYNYESGRTGKNGLCSAEKSRNGEYAIGGYINVDNSNCDDLYESLYTVQPISVAVDAGSWSFYSGGVL